MLIAKKTQSEVEILHIVSTPVDWVKLPKEKESLYPEVKHEISRAKTNMNELESRISAAGIAVKKSLEFNVGIEDVPKNIPTENVDMIIMGSHGTKGFKEDHEGISIFKTSDKTGFILISDQQANQFHVFRREGDAGDANKHTILRTIKTQTNESDGSDIIHRKLNSKFKDGLFVAMSDNKTFHFYSVKAFFKNL